MSRSKIEKAVARVDHVLEELRRRRLDPMKVLRAAIKRHDRRQQKREASDARSGDR